ncbi:hypothetical protein CIW53_15625 [Rhodanobacter sp. T12-5]|nr:hypothetical protein CIW53_15625 [Rhodanobacter sp. T12-5]
MRCRRHGLLAFASHAAAVLLPGAALHYLVERPFLQLRECRAGRTGGAGWRPRSRAFPASSRAGSESA